MVESRTQRGPAYCLEGFICSPKVRRGGSGASRSLGECNTMTHVPAPGQSFQRDGGKEWPAAQGRSTCLSSFLCKQPQALCQHFCTFYDSTSTGCFTMTLTLHTQKVKLSQATVARPPHLDTRLLLGGVPLTVAQAPW